MFYSQEYWQSFLIKRISKEILSINTEFYDSRDFNLKSKKSERVKELLVKRNADIYYSGPSAKDYLEEKELEDAGIKVVWMDYSGYLEYIQLFPPFEHNVSILDLIFNEGKNARHFLKSFP